MDESALLTATELSHAARYWAPHLVTCRLPDDFQRFPAAGLGLDAPPRSSVWYLGHSPDLEPAVQCWLHSTVHCETIADPRYSVAGGSVVQCKQGTSCVVLSSAK